MPLLRICEARTERGDIWEAAFSWDSGPQEMIEIRNPFSEENEKELEWYLEKYLEFPLVEGRRAEKAQKEITRYGESLFLDVFQAKSSLAIYEKLRDSGS